MILMREAIAAFNPGGRLSAVRSTPALRLTNQHRFQRRFNGVCQKRGP